MGHLMKLAATRIGSLVLLALSQVLFSEATHPAHGSSLVLWTPVGNSAICSWRPQEPVHLKTHVQCPVECPFSQPVDGVPCEKVCVQGDRCGEFHPVRFFAHPGTMRCEPSCGESPNERISGCRACVEPGICAHCSDGLFGLVSLELSDDHRTCVYKGRLWWYSFYAFASICAVAFTLYLVQVARRPIKNDEVLSKALDRRELARIELLPTKREGLSSKSWLWANIHRGGGALDFCGGRGVALYFNWLLFALFVAFILSVGAFYAFELSDLTVKVSDARSECGSSLMQLPRHGSASPETGQTSSSSTLETYVDSAAAQVRKLLTPLLPSSGKGGIEAKYVEFNSRMFRTSIALYVLVTLLVIGFSAFQHAIVARQFDSEPSVRHYAAVVSGLPRVVVDGRQLADHFRTTFDHEDLAQLWKEHGASLVVGSDEEASIGLAHGTSLKDCFQVVGASIAYDHYQHRDDIEREIHAWIQDLELCRSDVTSQAVESMKDDVKLEGPIASQQHCGTQTETRGDILAALDPGLLASIHEKEAAIFFDSIVLKCMGLREEWPLALLGSGVAFVVFSTRAARDAVVKLAATKRLPPLVVKDPRGFECHHPLHVEPAYCEPCSINWENFTSWQHFPQKIASGVVFVLLAMLAWLLFYLPYAVFYAELMVIPGLQPSATQDLLLGFFIAIGNMLLSVVIEKVTAWAGFRYKDRRDAAVLAMAFVFTFVNTVFDLAMVAIVARGQMIEDAFLGKETGYDTAVARELFKLIVPGYLLVPYLATPFFERVLPYWLATFFIRTHPRIQLQHATRSLRCPEFDICWHYADILNNTTICLVMLYFRSQAGWKVMVCLFLFLGLIYWIDKYLLLKAATPTFYDTRRLSVSFARWWVIPTALLASLVSVWGHKANVITSIPICIALPLVHMIVFLSALSFLEKRCPDQLDGSTLTYSEATRELRKACRPWDFFNTNPVFCLRSRFLGPDLSGWAEVRDFLAKSGGFDDRRDSPPNECVPFSRGSVWLLTEASQPTSSLDG